MRIGIFGGTFDPPHNGHLSVAKAAIRQLRLDVLYIIPCGNPVLKERSLITPARLRVAMCRLAFSGLKRCKVSLLEIRRKRKSYTVHTLEHFYRKGDRLFLITGSDAAPNPKTWYKFERIMKLCTVVVAKRKGSALQNSDFEILAGDFPEVSSTELRRALKAGTRAKELPKKVLEYITRKKIY